MTLKTDTISEGTMPAEMHANDGIYSTEACLTESTKKAVKVLALFCADTM